MKDFQDLGLSAPILSALDAMGFTTPTPIQSQTIPLLLSRPVDFIGLAQTGTGKTAAFGLPLLEMIDTDERHTQALILAPTRELAQQIAQQLKSFSVNLKQLNVVCVFGGASISQQIRELRKSPHIIVATPGRLIDLSERGAVRLDQADFIILDEADEMLNMGFKEELDKILAQTSPNKTTWLFSATMPSEIKRIIKNYMHDPEEVRIDSGQRVNVNIEHHYAVIKASDKVEALRRIMDFDPEMYGVVFCRTKIDTQRVAEELVETGYTAEALHGDLSQGQRDAVMKRFRSGNLQVLVATDVAARGIDVDNLTHVVHFALPDDPEYYVHRSGRTARAGKKGISLSLITKAEVRKLRFLENKLKINFTKALIPAAEEIAQNRIVHWANRLKEQEVHADEGSIEVANEILSSLDREELIAKMVSRQLGNISKQSSLSDLNDTSRESSGREPMKGRRDESGREKGMTTYFINIGRMDDMNKGALLRFVCDNSELTGNDIGRIQLEQKHAYVDVKDDQKTKIKALNGMSFGGREIRVNPQSGGVPANRRGAPRKKGSFKKKKKR